jgi:hypothetical protein
MAMPGLEAMWPTIEEGAQGMLNLPALSKIARKSSAKDRASAIAVGTAIIGVSFLEQLAQWRHASVTEIAVAQHVIPNRDALDKILRYETAIDRSMGRDLDRLERLQRRRRGERIPPPLSVCLTQ